MSDSETSQIVLTKRNGEVIELDASRYIILADLPSLGGVGTYTNMSVEEIVLMLEQLKLKLISGNIGPDPTSDPE